MCGRFTTTIDLEEIRRFFKIDAVEGNYEVLYNAAPAQNIPVILGKSPRTLSFYRWGLVPHWAKDNSIGNKLINARAETLLEKASFRQAYKKRRCLIPVDGFYEWKRIGGSKIPYRIIKRDKSPFALAGLWEMWSPSPETKLCSCTVITTSANSLVQDLHDRMPVILADDYDMDLWLDPDTCDYSLLNSVLKPYPSENLTYYRVSPQVNNSSVNIPQLINPVQDFTEQLL